MCKNLDSILQYVKVRDNYNKHERVALRKEMGNNIKQVSGKFVAFLDEINKAS
jgi:hypothetical protein